MKGSWAALWCLLLSCIGWLVVWWAADRLQGWAIPVALLWLVIVSKVVAITLAIRHGRAGG